MKKLLHTILIVLMLALRTGTAMADARGVQGIVQPDASLIFVIELLGLEKRAAGQHVMTCLA